jgi:hypothetical protein
MSRVCFVTVAVCVLALGPSRGLADEEARREPRPPDFVREVQPILRQNCGKCHGADEQNGGLRFDERATLFAEADSGALPVVPGHPEKSELIRRIRSADESDRMPPEGKRLAAAEIDLLTRWVAEGATWPEANPTTPPEVVKTEHWSFQPLTQPEPPAVNDETWPRNAIDRFVQARRESAGIKVAPDAAPEVLIRRASYGLTGLPPTPEEVREFTATAQSVGTDKAFAELLDRLLGRPAYGERWGRHWMDWVRYADTAGDNSDFPIPQAYLYRNYIIDSFNEDLPYDRLLIEQLAGDLLPAENQEQRNRQNIATGYLAMSRRFGSLVERYPWHLTVEDTIDNLGRTMLGLTISCARCHDHKFDPISTRDYYGLYGFFASTRYPFPGIELFQTQKDFVPLVPEAEAAAALAPFQETTDKLTSKVERLLAECEQKSLENAAQASTATLEEQRTMKDELNGMLIKARRAGEELAEHLKKTPELPTAYAVQDREPRNARIHLKGEPDRPGAEVPRKFLDVLGGQPLPDEVADSTSGRLELAAWITSPDNPLTARVIVNRIWQRHFGSGLVSTASDFGLRGEPPTHPELLDWLAGELIRSGWSLKHLHRVIMNSRAYQLSSWDVEENLAVDPGNRWYWKFNRQRLDAESIRDTLLLVAGSLDTAMPREPHPFPSAKTWKYTQHHPFKDEYSSNKRSVYLMTRRLTARPYFQTFDGPDPNACTSSRDQSVTALQALYFVNDEFLHEQARRFAERLLRDENDEHERLSLAFRTVVCRPPSSQETALLQEHLAAVRAHAARDSDVELHAWSSLARSLLRLNEFLYVD